MNTLIGLGELVIFLYLTNRTLRDSDNIIYNILFCYLCQILNYKLVGSLAWISFGVNLYPSDCTILLMIFIWAVKGMKIKKRLYMGLVGVFLVMAGQAAIRGLMTFGMSSEFWGDLRKFLYFGMSILYFYNVPIKRPLRAFERDVYRVFNFLTLYALIILSFYFAGMPLGERANERPLLADFAIIYAAFAAYNWYKDLILSDKPEISVKTILYTVTLILNRFNTTWVALLVSIGVLVISRVRDKNSTVLSKKFFFQVAIIAVLVGIFASSNNVVMDRLMESSAKFDTSENNTFSSRIELWQSMMDFVKGHYALIGYPFGSGFHAYYRGGYWKFTPHNGYIECLLRTGYIGVIALVMSMITIMRQAFMKRNILPIMLCTICLTFWVAYSLTFEQGIIIGVCAQYMFRRENENELDNIC